MFRSNSRSRSPSGFRSGDNGNHGLGIISEPDVRTRLLESYDRSGPVCGERRCSHGTFTPRPEEAERHSYLATSGGVEYPGGRDTGAASGHFNDDLSGSHAESEYTSQMKSSLSALSMVESKKQYVKLHEHPCSPPLAEANGYLQVHFLLHSFLQLDWTVSLVVHSRRSDSCADGLFHLHPNGFIIGL